MKTPTLPFPADHLWPSKEMNYKNTEKISPQDVWDDCSSKFRCQTKRNRWMERTFQISETRLVVRKNYIPWSEVYVTLCATKIFLLWLVSNSINHRNHRILIYSGYNLQLNLASHSSTYVCKKNFAKSSADIVSFAGRTMRVLMKVIFDWKG